MAGRPKGQPKTGGRVRGTPNKATREIKALASKYGEEAIEGIHGIATSSDNDATRLAAWNDLLDRGYGKPTQYIGGDEEAPPIRIIERIIVDPANKNS